MEIIHVEELNLSRHQSPVYGQAGGGYDRRVTQDYELDYIISANGGRMITNDSAVNLAPGMLFVRTPGMQVQGLFQYSSWYLKFQTKQQLSFPSLFYHMRPGICNPVFQQLYDIHIKRSADCEYLIDYYLNSLLFYIYEEAKRVEDIRQENHPLASVYHEMENSWKKNYSLEHYVRLSGYSKSRFCHLFQEIYQVSPMQFLHSLRLQNLCYSLIETDLPVKDLMIEHGYLNEQSFFRTFKAYTGETPAAYRRKHQLS